MFIPGNSTLRLREYFKMWKNLYLLSHTAYFSTVYYVSYTGLGAQDIVVYVLRLIPALFIVVENLVAACISNNEE